MSTGLLLAGLALLAEPSAPAAPPPAELPIVVQGVHDRDRKISNFIRDLTPAPVHGQLSRFDAPVCPAVAGLAREKADFIVGRMRRVAAAARIRVAQEGCEPNVILIVAQDKKRLLKQLEQYRPEYFPANWSSWHIHDLEHDPSTVAAWQFEGELWADGRAIDSGVTGSGIRDIGELQQTTEAQSRLKPSARHAFLTSVVVVQANALDGLTTTQLADYAAMRAFVRTDPQKLRSSGADTILGVIDAPVGSSIPLTLTAWDLSFLRAFYASSNNSYAEYQRSEMQRLMKRELDKAQQQ